MSTIALNLAVALAKLNPKPDPDKFAALAGKLPPLPRDTGKLPTLQDSGRWLRSGMPGAWP